MERPRVSDACMSEVGRGKSYISYIAINAIPITTNHYIGCDRHMDFVLHSLEGSHVTHLSGHHQVGGTFLFSSGFIIYSSAQADPGQESLCVCSELHTEWG